MTDITWFKLYHEALDDPKFLGIADRIMSRPGDVFHVFLKLLKRASENDERGSIAGFDEWGEAAWLRITVDEVRRIIEAIRDIGMIAGDRITRWAKRQGAAAEKLARLAAKTLTKSISPAAARQRKHREKLAAEADAEAREPEIPGLVRNVDRERDRRDSSVTCHAMSRADREERDDSEAVASESIDQTNRGHAAEFEEFWSRCPRKVGKGAARKAYAKARGLASWHTIMSGMLRYAAECDGREPRFIKHPATWLTAECWNDEPTPISIEFGHRGVDGLRPTLSRAEQRSLNNRRNLAAAMRAFEQRQQAA
jgi:hypothetical protein